MGFLSSKKTNCVFCQKEIDSGFFSLSSYEIKDGYVCSACFKKYNIPPMQALTLSTKQIIALEDQKKRTNELSNIFQPSKTITCPWVTKSNDAIPMDQPFIEVDEKNGLLNIPEYTDAFSKTRCNKFYKFNEILDFELLEDGATVTDGNSLLGAVVGGVLLGGVGAIVGSAVPCKNSKAKCTMMSIKITFNNMDVPVRYIVFINKETHHNDSNYKNLYAKAQECLSILTIIMVDNREQQKPQLSEPIRQQGSIADEILKFKQLLDIGAITQEEFDQKKNKLLSL